MGKVFADFADIIDDAIGRWGLVAGGVVLIDDSPRYASAARQLDLVGCRPGTDGL
jgi:hypothetical protein